MSQQENSHAAGRAAARCRAAAGTRRGPADRTVCVEQAPRTVTASSSSPGPPVMMTLCAPQQRLPGTPAVTVRSSLKRSLERDSTAVAEKAGKKPKHCGTIYESLLAPLSPATTLPVRQLAPRPAPAPNTDPDLQADFLDLVTIGKPAKLERFLESHAESVNLNQYSGEGLTPLQAVCGAGGAAALELARLLVRYGADTRLTSRDGWSPVHMATFSGNTALMLYLLQCRQ